MIYRPSLAVVFLLGVCATCVGQLKPPNLEKELRSENSNFSIMMPTVPQAIHGDGTTAWSESYPQNKPPYQFFSIVHLANIDNTIEDGNVVVKNLEVLQTNIMKAVGGAVLEMTPIRWKGHIGLRASMIHHDPLFPSPTVSTIYLVAIGKDVYMFSYGALAFGGKDYAKYQVNKGALDLFRTFKLINDVETTTKPLNPILEGSWVVRKATVEGVESQDEVGSEYSFYRGDFRRLSAEVLEQGEAPWPHAVFPSYGTYAVDEKLGHLDFKNEATKKLGLVQPAIYKFEGERLLVCVGPDSNNESDRPTTWESKQVSNHVLLEFSRPGDL